MEQTTAPSIPRKSTGIMLTYAIIKLAISLAILGYLIETAGFWPGLIGGIIIGVAMNMLLNKTIEKNLTAKYAKEIADYKTRQAAYADYKNKEWDEKCLSKK